MNGGPVIVLVHEIHGVNEHMLSTRDVLASITGLRTVVPGLLDPASEAAVSDEIAYRRFMSTIGCEGMAERLQRYIGLLRHQHDEIYCVGFSVGATASWLAACAGGVDLAVCVYGSRIRDHLAAGPRCPALVVFAADEPSFDVGQVAETVARFDGVDVEVIPAAHGFCNPADGAFDESHRTKLVDKIADFLLTVGVRSDE